MTRHQQTSGEYLKSLNILFLALLMGQVSFAAITYYLNIGVEPQTGVTRNMLIIVALFLMMNGFVLGNFLYKNQIRRVRDFNTLNFRLGGYRSAFILRLALLEGASLFSIVAYLLTADLIFMVIAGLIVAYFIFLRPNVNKIAMDLDLERSDKVKLENPDAIIAE